MNSTLCTKGLRNFANKSLLLIFFLFAPFFIGITWAQQNTVTGKVTDESNQPVANATVSVKGKSQATTTGDNGSFSINAAAGDKLVISSVGFEDLEIRIGSSTVINAILKPGNKSMDEVIVVGYGSTTRKNLTTSIAKIDPKNIPQAANSSLAQLVFGRAPGVQAVQQSAEPGGNIVLSIRGRGNPLVVVDGVVMPYAGLEPGNNNIANELNGVRRGGFAGISPDDIESIEFLKDASAAIYGVNASNGVVLITTKKGKSGRLSLNYDGSRSYVKNMKYLEPLNAMEYMTFYNQLSLDKYLFDNGRIPYGTGAATGFVPKYSQSDIQNAGVGTDWLGQVLRNGSVDNHSVSVSGGNDKAVYYLSGGYFNQVGTMQQSGMQRYTGRANLTFNFTKWVSLNANISGSKTKFANSTAGWQNGGSGTQGFGALQAALAYPASVPVYDAAGKYSLFQVTGNPVSLLDIKDKSEYNSLNTTVSLDFKILGNELTGRVLYGNNYENTTRDFFVPSTTFYFQLYRARGSLNQAQRQLQTLEANVSYRKKFFNNILGVDAVAGVGQYTNTSYGFGAASADMLDGIGTDNLFAGTGSIIVSSYKGYDRKRSYYARSSFDLFDKYVVQLTGRYDGYSQFFPENKYAFFPSASVGWKISNESFMKNVTFIDLLKLRGSIGITGEASGFAYAAYSPDNSIISFNSGATQILPYTLTQLDHPELQWPKTINKNIGLDFSILKDRVSGSFDWFRDDITRLISNATTAPLSFLGTAPVNGAHRIRTGWEAGINSKNVSAKDFSWNSFINVSHVLYKHEERFPFDVLPKGAKVNDPVNSYYVFRTNGIIQAGEAPTAWQATLPARAQLAGNPRMLDLNNDKKLDTNDIVRYNSDPKITIGFGNTFTWKQFDLSIFFYGQIGGWGYNNLLAWASPGGIIAGNQSGIKQVNNIWTSTNPSGTYPGIAYDQAALGLPAGIDIGLEKTDFIRCRNITLGYSFDQASVRKYFKGLRVYADVQNAFIITNYRIADPEVQAIGVKGGPAPYPMATTYSIGVKANL